ncbi:MAG: GntR family transcriptional regulator [Lachnospiraceae bacterium]|nr:GntR family transcriptional regulator [Lachnospiraceae bacterium]MBO5146426.1 GntR family transcriptional regulator [Lachnospiraceae bacterium]
MDFAKTKKETLTDKVHNSILEMIIQNAAPEDMVLNESRLVEIFGVSKAPVREALIRLCSEGVLEIIPRYGYVVVRLTEKDEKDVANMRLMLETEALRNNFGKFSQCHLDRLREQIERSCAVSSMSIWDMLNFNEEFHMLLAANGENKIMNRFLGEILQIQKRIYARHWWRDQKTLDTNTNAVPHMKIYQALCDGSLEQCMDALRHDITGGF